MRNWVCKLNCLSCPCRPKDRNCTTTTKCLPVANGGPQSDYQRDHNPKITKVKNKKPSVQAQWFLMPSVNRNKQKSHLVVMFDWQIHVNKNKQTKGHTQILTNDMIECWPMIGLDRAVMIWYHYDGYDWFLINDVIWLNRAVLIWLCAD
jgi:hypothetical protein